MLRLDGKVSKNTFDAYSGTTRFFIQAIDYYNYSKLPTEKFSRAYAKKCLDWIVEERKWSNKAYNKNLGFIRSVFSEIIESEQAEINPFREIKNLKTEFSTANLPPTDQEMKLICDELKSKNYGFYIFYMLIYYCGIRPDEARQLKVSDLNFIKNIINLPGKITKNGKSRSIPMLGIFLGCCSHAKMKILIISFLEPGCRMVADILKRTGSLPIPTLLKKIHQINNGRNSLRMDWE